MWAGMSLRDAVAWAGSLDALMPHLKNARIMARGGGGFYTSDGRPMERADDRIPASWWEYAHDIDPATGRAYFTTGPAVTWTGADEIHQADVLVIGIELERAAVEALPKAPVSAAAPRHAGGIDPLHGWESAAQYVTDWKAKPGRGPLPRKKNGQPNKAFVMKLMRNWFEANEPRPWPTDTDIYRWLREHPQTWWD